MAGGGGSGDSKGTSRAPQPRAVGKAQVQSKIAFRV